MTLFPLNNITRMKQYLFLCWSFIKTQIISVAMLGFHEEYFYPIPMLPSFMLATFQQNSKDYIIML